MTIEKNYLDNMAGVTDSPNLAMGFGAVWFFSNNFLRSLIGSIAGSGVLCPAGDPDWLSNKFRFSSKLFLDAVSVKFWASRDGDLAGDLVTGVTVTVFSVRQVLVGTSGFERSSGSAEVTLFRADVT